MEGKKNGIEGPETGSDHHVWEEQIEWRRSSQTASRTSQHSEHRGEEAGAVHVSMWGAGAELRREESPRAGSGPGAKAGLTLPIFHTAVRESILCWGFSGKLSVLRYAHRKAGHG